MAFPQRLVHLPVLALPLLGLALTPVGAASAAAEKAKSVKGYAVPCLKSDGQTWQYTAKPAACVLADDLSQERSFVSVKKLDWTTWSATRARATGTVKGDGYSGKVVVTATKPRRCSSRRVIYTVVSVSIPKMGSIARVTVACPK